MSSYPTFPKIIPPYFPLSSLTLNTTIMHLKTGLSAITLKCNSSSRFTQLLLCLLFISFSFSLNAQTAAHKQVYVAINYIKTNPGKQSAYLDLIKNYTKKINEFNFKKGRILGTYVNSVVLPAGAEAEYNIAIVTVTDNLNFLLNDTVPGKSLFKSVFPEYSDNFIESIMDQYGEIRTIVKREIFTAIAEIDPAATPTTFAAIDFMKVAPGKDSAYVKLEKEVWMPIHKERIKMGVMVDWLLMSKFMPLNVKDEYRYVTGNFFNNLNFLEDGKYPEAIKKAFPNTDLTKSLNETGEARTIVKEELWKLELFVDHSNTK